MFFIITSLSLAFFLGEVSNHYSIVRISYFLKLDDRSFYITIALFGFISLFFLFLISSFIKSITIDSYSKTMIFKNIVTRQTKSYAFSDFDGYIDTFLNHKSASYKTIGLIKDKKVIHYIDSFWVSNYDELRQSLEGLEYLGTYNFGILKQFKMLFRQPVID